MAESGTGPSRQAAPTRLLVRYSALQRWATELGGPACLCLPETPSVHVIKRLRLDSGIVDEVRSSEPEAERNLGEIAVPGLGALRLAHAVEWEREM